MPGFSTISQQLFSGLVKPFDCSTLRGKWLCAKPASKLSSQLQLIGKLSPEFLPGIPDNR